MHFRLRKIDPIINGIVIYQKPNPEGIIDKKNNPATIQIIVVKYNPIPVDSLKIF
jgi:hypothetical protein